MRKLEDKPWWPELLAKKDDHSLRELAEIFSATPGAINNALKRNGITRTHAPPGPRKRRGRPPAPNKLAPPDPAEAEPQADTTGRQARPYRKSRIEPFAHLLGKLADGEIAAQAGVSRAAVRNYRARRNIPAARPRGGLPRLEGRQAPAASIAGSRLAFRVDFDDHKVVVVGLDLVDAARKALGTGQDVRCIELVGEVL